MHLNKKNYKIIELIGSGGESIVFKAIDINKNQQIAIKLSLFDKYEKVINQKKREQQIIKSIQCHKYIIQIIEQFIDWDCLILVSVMELCKNNLNTEIKDQQLNINRIVNIFYQLINSVIEIHTNNILHCDIKPQNILQLNNEYKLADFGMSNVLYPHQADCNKFKGYTELYSSPELNKINLSNKQNKPQTDLSISYASDVFSLGLTFLYVLGIKIEEKIQLDNFTDKITIAQAIRNGYWPDLEKKVDEKHLTLLSFVRYYMLSQDPNKRKRLIIIKKILISYYNGKNMDLNNEIERIKQLLIDSKIKYSQPNKYQAYLHCLLGQFGVDPTENFKQAYDIGLNTEGFCKQDLYYFLEEYGTSLSNNLKYESAKKELLKCLELRTNENILQDVAESKMSLSQLYKEMGEFRNALKFEKRALKNWKNSYPKNHPDIAGSLNRVGFFYVVLAKHSRGLKFQLKALNMKKKLFTGHHPDIAESYESIAKAYQRLGQYEKSIEYFLLAKEMWESIQEGNSQQTAEVLYYLGQVYGSQGKKEVSLDHFQRSLEMRKSIFNNEDHPKIAQSYLGMSIAYGKLSDKEKVLEWDLKALEMRKRIFPSNHPDIAESLSSIGVSYLRRREFTKAIEHLLPALKIRQTVFPKEHIGIAFCLNNIGVCFGRLKELETALKYQFESLEMRKKLFYGDHPDLASAYRSIGSVCHINDEHQKSIENNLKALEMRERLNLKDYDDIDYILMEMSISYQKLGDEINEQACKNKRTENQKNKQNNLEKK